MKAVLQHEGDGRFSIQGPLVFETADSLWRRSGSQFEAYKSVRIDFSQVDDVDSSAVAVLLAWCRLSKRNKKTIEFHAVPDSLKSIIEISDLNEIIPLID